jgi:Kip1 ubiquitination-promoting complex protein 1
VLRDVFDLTSSGPITFKHLSAALQQRIAQYDAASDTRQVSEKEVKSESPALSPDSVLNANHVIGRLGPAVAQLDLEHSFGLLVLSDDQLQLESESNFASIRGNVCVYQGQWQYEVVLLTSGISQLGWASPQCAFTDTNGVGDSPDSYAFDGKRVKKWNMREWDYGEKWKIGDVIGCCIDADQGSITYYRNGKSLGVAFANIRTHQPGLAYFPALSIGGSERCRINFGGETPLQYPIEGYRTLDLRNFDNAVKKSDYLLGCVLRLIQRMDTGELASPVKRAQGEDVISGDQGLILLAHVFAHLGSLLTIKRVVIQSITPFLLSLFAMRAKFAKTIELFLSLIEVPELDTFVAHLFAHLADATLATPVGAQTSGSAHLKLAVKLLSFRSIMHTVSHLPSFAQLMESFFCMKQPNSADLHALIPTVVYMHAPDQQQQRASMDEAMRAVRESIEERHTYLLHLCELFITDAEPTSLSASQLQQSVSNTNVSALVQSPREIFRQWLRDVVKKNSGALRDIRPSGLSSGAAMQTLALIIARLFDRTHPQLTAEQFPYAMFYHSTRNYFDFPRLGGVETHLSEHFKVDPSSEHAARVEETDVRVELLEDWAWLLTLRVGVKFRKTAELHARAAQLTAQLEELDKKISQHSSDSTTANHLHLARQVFFDEWSQLSRLSHWHTLRAGYYSRDTRRGEWAVLAYLTQLVCRAHESGPLLAWVPAFYAETLVRTLHIVRRGPLAVNLGDEEHAATLQRVLYLFTTLLKDPRVIQPDVREHFLQSLGVLLQYKQHVRVLESDERVRGALIPSLLASFDDKTWILISSVLLRFWKGSGFAESVDKSECCSSVVQRDLSAMYASDRAHVAEFINKLFNNINLALSELTVAIDEILAHGNRTDTAQAQQSKRKFVVVYEASCPLLRLFEVIAKEVPLSFTELNESRLCELLVYILNRVTVGQDSLKFDTVIKGLTSADRVNPLEILAPLAGIILHMSRASQSFMNVLANTGGLNTDTLRYLSSFPWPQHHADLTGDARHHKDVQQFSQLVTEIETRVKQSRAQQAASNAVSSEGEDGELCPICYSATIDTQFSPCQHRSCYRCISLHLLNKKQCFFCNAPLEAIQRLGEAPMPITQ